MVKLPPLGTLKIGPFLDQKGQTSLVSDNPNLSKNLNLHRLLRKMLDIYGSKN